MRKAIQIHWPEYLMEAAALGLFMLSACLVTVWLEHPGSVLRGAIPSAGLRHVIAGLAMGATLIGLVYSPWGQQSGAHMNPAFTLAFLTLRKIAPWDAAFYIAAQFAGGVAGVLAAALLAGAAIRDKSVNYAVTVPGPLGIEPAFVAEAGISFVLMLTVLVISNNKRIARYTGFAAAVLVALFISLEAPLSGMSMNPARTAGSALPAQVWTALWIYFTAPPLGMLGAAAAYRLAGRRVLCAKLYHENNKRCIFRCGWMG